MKQAALTSKPSPIKQPSKICPSSSEDPIHVQQQSFTPKRHKAQNKIMCQEDLPSNPSRTSKHWPKVCPTSLEDMNEDVDEVFSLPKREARIEKMDTEDLSAHLSRTPKRWAKVRLSSSEDSDRGQYESSTPPRHKAHDKIMYQEGLPSYPSRTSRHWPKVCPAALEDLNDDVEELFSLPKRKPRIEKMDTEAHFSRTPKPWAKAHPSFQEGPDQAQDNLFSSPSHMMLVDVMDQEHLSGHLSKTPKHCSRVRSSSSSDTSDQDRELNIETSPRILYRVVAPKPSAQVRAQASVVKKKVVVMQRSINSYFKTEPPPGQTEARSTDIVARPAANNDLKRPRKRGRPTKLEQLRKQVKIENAAEVVMIDVPETTPKTAHKRGPYLKVSYAVKLIILKKYQVYLANPPRVNGKIVGYNEFCRDVAAEQNMSYNSVKTLCSCYDKKPSFFIQLEKLCSNEKSARESGHVLQRAIRLTYSPDIDEELVDWMYGCIDLGYIITRDLIRNKALELIAPSTPKFKATSTWLDCFMSRHCFSFRKLNQKCAIQDEYLRPISEKFRITVRDIIEKYRIKPEYILNMDETPYYWEYLPRRVATPTLSSTTKAWKRGYHQMRSTLMLTASASGTLLRPALVLKREQRYRLRCINDIRMLLMSTPSGWVKEDTYIEWLTEILIPYVKKNHCLLLVDSFDAHISPKVNEFLKAYPNIHVAVIVGGTTSTDQPLDVKINKAYKEKCKSMAYLHTNAMMFAMHHTDSWQKKQRSISTNILSVNNQIVISEKDHKRKRYRNTTLSDMFTKITVEDIYSFIRAAHTQFSTDSALIKSSFVTCGYIDDPNANLLLDELSNRIEQLTTDDIEPEEDTAEDEHVFIVSDESDAADEEQHEERQIMRSKISDTEQMDWE